MDYNRLLNHFDLEEGNDSNMQGRSGRKRRGRRNTKQQRTDNASLVDATKEFGRVLISSQDRTEMNDLGLDKQKKMMKRLRKRITV